MEFRVPRLDEQVDDQLVQGHEWKIFPLLNRRRVFAGAENFHLFDFYTAAGRVNENVLAYSNRRGSEKALVLYHNKYANARGWTRISASALDKSSGQLRQRSLGEALDLPRNGFAVFKDHVARLEYIRDCAELWEKGFYAELSAYQHQVFMDWKIVYGADWEAVHRRLDGAGVDSVQAMLDGISVGTAVVQAAGPLATRGAKTPKGTRTGARTKAALKTGAKRASTRPARGAVKKSVTNMAAAKKTLPRKAAATKAPKKAPRKAPKRTPSGRRQKARK
jgi:hypothetical protein